MKSIRNPIARLPGRLHSNERGAVALATLAAVLILFMGVMVMFDVGKATQAKTDVQMGADTAAYSAGATGARSMNMVSFANVGKRTAVGIHNMYVFEYQTYVAWVGMMCGCCCNCPVVCCPDFTCCFNCIGNGISLIPIFEMIDMISYMTGNDLFKNLEELHAFQEGVSDVAKSWGAGEAQARGVRNGAHMMAVWPDPHRSDDRYAKLPIELSEYKSESCLAPVPFLTKNPITMWTTIEFFVNWRVLVDRSTSSPNIAPDGPAEVAEGTAHKFPVPAFTRAMLACIALDNIVLALAGGIFGFIAHMNVPDEAAPMFLDVPDSSNPWLSGDDQLRMSYMLYSYQHVPKLGRRWRDNYDFLRDDYNQGTMTLLPETGVFGMARSEFYFPPPNQPSMLKRGEHEMWMFHPGWMGKLRPVMLPYESTDIASESWQIEMTDMVDESLPTGVLLAMGIFGISGVPSFDGGGFLADQAYLRMNVARDMVGYGSFAGGDPHHYLDGSAK